MSRLLIIKTGSAVSEVRQAHGDFDLWFRQTLGLQDQDCTVVSVHDNEDLPDDLSSVAAVLVTGSPAMVSHRAEWSERTAKWLKDFHALARPMLGVCYGHQLLAYALGGKVGPNPRGRHMGTRRVQILAADDPLLGPCPPTTSFQVTHVEVVLEPPPGARILARAEHDPHHALHFGHLSWGLQFHPELDEAVMAAYIQSRSSVLAGEGIAAETLLDTLETAPQGAAVLARFSRIMTDYESFSVDQASHHQAHLPSV